MISFRRASIVTIKADAIVCEVDTQFQPRTDEAKAIWEKVGPIKTITPAVHMRNCKYVIPAVAPKLTGMYAIRLHEEYEKVLNAAAENGCKSVAFPLILADANPMRLDIMWRKAMHGCLGYCSRHDMEVYFAVPDQELRELGERIYQLESMNYPAYIQKLTGETIPDGREATKKLIKLIRSLNQRMTREELDEKLAQLEQLLDLNFEDLSVISQEIKNN